MYCTGIQQKLRILGDWRTQGGDKGIFVELPGKLGAFVIWRCEREDFCLSAPSPPEVQLGGT